MNREHLGTGRFGRPRSCGATSGRARNPRLMARTPPSPSPPPWEHGPVVGVQPHLRGVGGRREKSRSSLWDRRPSQPTAPSHVAAPASFDGSTHRETIVQPWPLTGRLKGFVQVEAPRGGRAEGRHGGVQRAAVLVEALGVPHGSCPLSTATISWRHRVHVATRVVRMLRRRGKVEDDEVAAARDDGYAPLSCMAASVPARGRARRRSGAERCGARAGGGTPRWCRCSGGGTHGDPQR